MNNRKPSRFRSKNRDTMKHIKPFYWDSGDIDGEDGKFFSVTIWGHNPSNEVISVRIDDYQPWIHLTLPDGVNESIAELVASEIFDALNVKLWGRGDDDHRPTKFDLSMRLPLYYYCKEPSVVMKMHFKSEEAVTHCKNLLKWPVKTEHYGAVKLLVTAVKIDQLTRLHADLDIKPCSWMEYMPKDNIRSVTTCDVEHLTSWKSVKNCDDETASRLGETYPSYLVFDGEMFAHRKGAFPDELNSKDSCFMIGMLHFYWKDGAYATDEYCLVYHPTLKYDDSMRVRNCMLAPKPMSDRYEVLPRDGDVKQLWFENEVDMISYFEKLVQDLDPDGLIGHNSNSFDFKYLKTRKARMAEPFQNLTRVKEWNQNYQNIAWASSAYGEIDLWVPDGAGRLYFDTLQMTKRDYKQDSYSLDALSKNFLGIGKAKWSVEDMFKAFREADPDGMRETIIYCMRDVWCTWGLFSHLNFWLSYSGMSSIMGIGIFDLFSRGQGIRTRALMFKECYHNGYFMHSPDREQRSIAGGYVFPQLPGLYEWVLLVDFQGLYPAIMRRFNISNDTYDLNNLAADEDCNILEWDDQHGHWRTKFVKPHIRKGLVPRTLEKLTEARNAYKAKMNDCKRRGDKRGAMINDVAQNVCKISSNSVYGGLAQKGGHLGLEEAGAAVTAYGRMLVQKAAKWARERGWQVVYGDTDSIMITKVGGLTEDEKIRIYGLGQKLVDDMNSECFQHPIKMELDGVFRTMLSIKKKMYTFISVDKDDPLSINPSHWKSKGLPTARRDTCRMMRNLYHNVAVGITTKKEPDQIIIMLSSEIERLLRGDVTIEEMTTIMKLGTTYKNPNYPLAIFQKHLIRQGMTVKPGDRVPFVYVDRPHQHQGECFEDPEVFERANVASPGSMKLNRMMYLTSQFAKKLDTILHAAYPELIPVEFLTQIPKLLGIKPQAEIINIMIACMQSHMESPSECECHSAHATAEESDSE